MGQYLGGLRRLFRLSHRGPIRILMLGLDCSGKTTALYKMRLGRRICVIPTIGFNVETLELTEGVEFTVWDVGGREKIRGIWQSYYKTSEGLIFVVDCSDSNRLEEAREELHAVLQADDMAGLPFVIFANKQDEKGALTPDEITDEFDLIRFNGCHKWHVQGTCAKTGDGILEAMKKLHEFIK